MKKKVAMIGVGKLIANEVLEEKDLIEVRPCPVDAIPPSVNIVGKTLTKDLAKKDYLKYEHIK